MNLKSFRNILFLLYLFLFSHSSFAIHISAIELQSNAQQSSVFLCYESEENGIDASIYQRTAGPKCILDDDGFITTMMVMKMHQMLAVESDQKFAPTDKVPLGIETRNILKWSLGRLLDNVTIYEHQRPGYYSNVLKIIKNALINLEELGTPTYLYLGELAETLVKQENYFQHARYDVFDVDSNNSEKIETLGLIDHLYSNMHSGNLVVRPKLIPFLKNSPEGTQFSGNYKALISRLSKRVLAVAKSFVERVPALAVDQDTINSLNQLSAHLLNNVLAQSKSKVELVTAHGVSKTLSLLYSLRRDLNHPEQLPTFILSKDQMARVDQNLSKGATRQFSMVMSSLPKDANLVEVIEMRLNENIDVFDFIVPGQEELAAQTINDRVNATTNGLIPELVQTEHLQNTDLALVSALYFQDDWSQPFAKEVQSEFTTYDGATTDITYLYDKRSLSYFINPKGDLSLRLPFKQGYFLYVDMKIESTDLMALNSNSLREIDSNVKTQEAKIYFPKLNIENEVNLKELLSCIGLEDLHETGIELIDGTHSIDNFFQKNVFKTTLTGAQAGSGTFMGTSRGIDLTPVVEVNHPFAFALVDNQGQIIMNGFVREL